MENSLRGHHSTTLQSNGQGLGSDRLDREQWAAHLDENKGSLQGDRVISRGFNDNRLFLSGHSFSTVKGDIFQASRQFIGDFTGFETP